MPKWWAAASQNLRPAVALRDAPTIARSIIHIAVRYWRKVLELSIRNRLVLY
jgi:hypothetical protein